MRHIDVLEGRFGKEAVLGGQCGIAATLDEHHHVVQLAPVFQSLTFGERDRTMSDRIRAIAKDFARANIGSQASEHIMQEMWEKWVMLTTLASSTCLMRAPVGHILAAPGGREFILGVRDECIAVARAAEHAPREAFLTRVTGMLTVEGSPLTASMFRDIKAGAPVEADHIVGDMIARGDAAKVPVPRLRVAYTHLKAYENQRG